MDFDARLRQAVDRFAPGARPIRSWILHGGISAKMTAFEVLLPDGSSQTLISRQPSPRHVDQNPDAAAREFRVLRALFDAGLPTPRPVWLDEQAEPFFVMEYIEGLAELGPSDKCSFLRQYAELLTKIHQLDLECHDLSFLPRQQTQLNTERFSPNRDMREEEIYAALAASVPPKRLNKLALLHGDFWPGNLLWRDGALVGVIDWEDAVIGEPLADLAVSRLDLLWILGIEAMHEFTDSYQAKMALDLTDLPYWDLRISLRLVSILDECASGYPSLGRPDITAESMREGHSLFVEQALRGCKRSSVRP